MNFIDAVEVEVIAGDGGDGLVSFRHEKFIEKGGPDGGDGGRGGSVIFEASRNQNTLANFRYKKQLSAQSGQPGGQRNMHGKNGEDLVVPVPVGTVVTRDDGTALADLAEDGQQVVIARAGDGGFGNAHFKSSRRQAPRIAEKGEKGERLTVTLELKMIADVGLVGLPNAGKSTFLSVISNARPEIADYPFTTLTPNLGMVDFDGTGLLFADIPGLIEGASQGKGLGDEFLRHIERTSVLLHLIDVYQDDIAAAYTTIQGELKAYKVDLTTRPQLVVLNKIDGVPEETINNQVAALQKVAPKDTEIATISAQSGKGVKQLLYKVKQLVEAERQKQAESDAATLPVITLPRDKDLPWQIKKTDNGFVVTGTRIEKFARRTHFSDFHGEQRLRDIMGKMGIMHELMRQGVESGQRVAIGDPIIGSITY